MSGVRCLIDSPTRCVVQPRDGRLLVDLCIHRVLTRDQIIRLGHFQSVGRCNARLLRLKRHGYLRRLRHPAWGSSSASLYSIGSQAIPILSEALPIPVEVVASMVGRKAPTLFLEHTLLLTDLRCVFSESLAREGVRDSKWLPESLCYHEYRIGGLKRVIKPDAFVRWSRGGRAQNWFVELDLGNASQTALRSKLDLYGRYLADGAYREAYGAESFGLLIVTSGHRRIENLMRQAPVSLTYRLLATSHTQLDTHGPFAPIWYDARGSFTSLQEQP